MDIVLVLGAFTAFEAVIAEICKRRGNRNGALEAYTFAAIAAVAAVVAFVLAAV